MAIDDASGCQHDVNGTSHRDAQRSQSSDVARSLDGDAALDLLREALGDAPADWFPALTGSKWPGGANDTEEAGTIPLGLAAE